MSEEMAADKAIAGLNGGQLGGCSLTLNEAKPIVPREFGGDARRGGRRERY